ncbi:MAG: peroxide stress protein YaaA [Burkholderiaceae bacterium]|nr:peroxide stress protein YaaA [Burkholderiaceae bacterium]
MLLLLSPAKSLNFEPLAGEMAESLPHTLPHFSSQSAQLITELRKLAPQDIADLMSLSDALSSLNVARYLAWSPKFTAKNAKQAILAFNGDVYAGFEAASLKQDDLAWAQDHVCILSGLYGVLRPLDRMQPYRLEMGTRLAVPTGTATTKNLYGFWGSRISDYLNQRLKADATPIVINLASQEYFKSVETKVLKARVIECVFEEFKNGQYKIISFMAKKARGLMARYIVTHRIMTPSMLKRFNLAGYAFDAQVSTLDRMVFRRKIQP